MAKNIDTKLKNIQNFFVNGQENILGINGKFIIPEYQRAYNWKTNEQCDKLWQDIEAFIDNKQNESYFLGSIIINNESEKLYLIDGQQRVTTFFLLLKALLLKINDILSNFVDDEDSKQLKEGLESRRKNIIQCLYFIDEDDVYLITNGSKMYSELEIKYLNQSLNEEYKEELPTILRGNNYSEIENNVTKIKVKQKNNEYTNFYNNFLFFKEKFDNMGNEKINKFAKELLAKCQVIVVISYQTEESIEIFNSLNSTGMPLADADIVSAKLYANYGIDKKQFKTAWEDIVKRTNSLFAKKIVTIDDILNEYMYIQRASKGEKETTMPGVRRYFLENNKQLLSNPSKFVDDMQRIIGFWEEMSEENLDDKQKLELKNLCNIREILLKNNSNFKFYYATYLYCNSDKPLNEKIVYSENLLKLFALLTITGISYSSSKFKQFLIDLNMRIATGISIEEIVSLFEQHISANFDKDNILNLLKTNYCHSGIVFLNDYLYAREKKLPINLSLDNIQIEHIMPASGKNLAAIREDANMTQEEFVQNVDKVGNKILLEQNINGSISNDWFRVKKQTSVKNKRGYQDSIFPLAQALTAYPNNTWTKNDIENATEKASKRIVKFIFD